MKLMKFSIFKAGSWLDFSSSFDDEPIPELLKADMFDELLCSSDKNSDSYKLSPLITF
jgi:hypothetical protein